MEARSHISAGGPGQIAALCGLLVLAACGTPIMEQASRDVAKNAVNDVVAQQFPGVNAAPYTDCIIDAATGEELVTLAQYALTQNSSGATSAVLQIAQRPQARNCIAQNALTSLL